MNCNHCGTPLAEGAAVCGVCGTPVQIANPAQVPARERVGLGILGALIGALIGGASIVILSRLGFIAAISGVLIAFCTLKGYELLAKKLSKTGIIICIALLVITPFLASIVDLGLSVYDDYKLLGASLIDAYALLPELIAADALNYDVYFSNLGMLYAFVALGAFSIIRNALRQV